jgi:glycosyltransferase involved in cell wall biosynthesis
MVVAVLNQMLSLICTIYNRDRYLHQMIDSILQQNYQNWELIVVNDGSDPKFSQSIEDVISRFRDKRIKYFSQNHLGRSKQLKYAQSLVNSDCDYIAWIDDDDMLYGSMTLNRCIRAIESDPQISLVFTNYAIFNNQTKQITPSLTHDLEYKHGKNSLIGADCFHLQLFRKSDYEKVGGFDPQLTYAIDCDLALRLEEVGKVVKLMFCGYLWRIHGDQITVNHQNQQAQDRQIAINSALQRRFNL